MRNRSLLLRVLTAAAGVLVAALLLVWLLFDPNDYKDEAEAAFLERTGRVLRFEGDPSLSMFPWLAVKTGAASISNGEGFDAAPFASLKHARISVRLPPLLLRREIRIGKVEMDGLHLNLQVAKNGRNNWSDLLERVAKERAAEPPGADEERRAPASVGVAGLAITNARITLDDRKAGTRYELRDWTLQTGKLGAGKPFDLHTSLALLSGDEPLVRVELDGEVDASQASRITVRGLDGEIVLPGVGANKEDVPIDLVADELSVDTTHLAGQATGLRARLGDALIEAQLQATSGKNGVGIRGPVSLVATNPRELLKALGRPVPVTRDGGVLESLEARGQLVATARGFDIQELTAQMDDTRLVGRLGVADFKRKALRFNLQADQLDLDRYRAPPAKDASAGQAAGRPVEPLPVDALRKLDCNGTLSVERLVVNGIDFGNLTLPLVAKGGRMRIDRAAARAFGGKLSLGLALDVTGETPGLHLEPRLQDVDVQQVLGQTIDVRQLTGRARAEASLDAKGVDAAAMQRSLRGRFDLAVRDGALVGADLWHEIERAVAVAQGRPPPAGAGAGRTEFDFLSARGTLSDRTLHNEVFAFSNDFVRARGRGDVNFGAQTVNLDLKARLLRVPPGKLLGLETSQLAGVDLPLTVTGPLARPEVKPDVGMLLGEVVKKKATREIEKEIKKRLQDLLGS